MRTTTLVQATVKYAAGSPRTTSDGRQRVNVVVTLADGREERLWGDPGDPITRLKKGQRITLAQNSKGFTLVADGPNPTPGAVAATVPVIPPAIEPTSPDVAEWVALFREFRAALPEQSEQCWRAAASTVYMQRRKRFGSAEQDQW